jgi:hypothetical protein
VLANSAGNLDSCRRGLSGCVQVDLSPSNSPWSRARPFTLADLAAAPFFHVASWTKFGSPKVMSKIVWVLKKSYRLQDEVLQKHARRKHPPMLCLIPIVGGLLIMMGQHGRSEALFYYFRREDQIPETHLLRLIEKHISFASARREPSRSYHHIHRNRRRSQRYCYAWCSLCRSVSTIRPTSA